MSLLALSKGTYYISTWYYESVSHQLTFLTPHITDECRIIVCSHQQVNSLPIRPYGDTPLLIPLSPPVLRYCAHILNGGRAYLDAQVHRRDTHFSGLALRKCPRLPPLVRGRICRPGTIDSPVFIRACVLIMPCSGEDRHSDHSCCVYYAGSSLLSTCEFILSIMCFALTCFIMSGDCLPSIWCLTTRPSSSHHCDSSRLCISRCVSGKSRI